MDLFEEMATIARPPLASASAEGGGSGSGTGSKRPLTDETGYIVCLYKVFRGDDGEKFERNWLFWTGEWYNTRIGIASSCSGIGNFMNLAIGRQEEIIVSKFTFNNRIACIRRSAKERP